MSRKAEAAEAAEGGYLPDTFTFYQFISTGKNFDQLITSEEAEPRFKRPRARQVVLRVQCQPCGLRGPGWWRPCGAGRLVLEACCWIFSLDESSGLPLNGIGRTAREQVGL